MSVLWCGVLLGGAYLVGSIPFGFLVGRAKGVDLRTVGSRNIGASNLGRTFGRSWFAVCLLLDALKGALPVCVGKFLLKDLIGTDDWSYYLLWVLAGVAAILGHTFPLWLKFKGGKAVATSLGVALGIWPYFTIPALIAFGLWWVAVLACGYISVASVVAAAAFPVIYFFMHRKAALAEQWPLLIVCVLIATLIVLRHRDNLRRLRQGTESKAAFLSGKHR